MNITFEQVIAIVENDFTNVTPDSTVVANIARSSFPYCQHNTTTRYEAFRDLYMIIDQADDEEQLIRKERMIKG
jgi:hypothetical protein